MSRIIVRNPSRSYLRLNPATSEMSLTGRGPFWDRCLDYANSAIEDMKEEKREHPRKFILKLAAIAGAITLYALGVNYAWQQLQPYLVPKPPELERIREKPPVQPEIPQEIEFPERLENAYRA